MSETRDGSSDGDQEGAASLRDALGRILGSAPAPEPELSDDELLAEIRRAAATGDDADEDPDEDPDDPDEDLGGDWDGGRGGDADDGRDAGL